jgi:hypothetical protein
VGRGTSPDGDAQFAEASIASECTHVANAIALLHNHRPMPILVFLGGAMKLSRTIQLLLFLIALISMWATWTLMVAPPEVLPESATNDSAPPIVPDPRSLPQTHDLPPLIGAAASHTGTASRDNDEPEANAGETPEFTSENRTPYNVGDPSITPDTDPTAYLRSEAPVVDVGPRLADPAKDTFLESDEPIRNVGSETLKADPES